MAFHIQFEVDIFAYVLTAMIESLILLCDEELPSSVLFSAIYVPVFLVSIVLNGSRTQCEYAVAQNEGANICCVICS